jgi:hypothetical protein
MWAYDGPGQYRGTLSGVFLQDKTYTNITNSYNSLVTTDNNPLVIDRLDNDAILVQSYTQIEGPFEGRDGALYFTPIEIRVYN